MYQESMTASPITIANAATLPTVAPTINPTLRPSASTGGGVDDGADVVDNADVVCDAVTVVVVMRPPNVAEVLETTDLVVAGVVATNATAVVLLATNIPAVGHLSLLVHT